MSHPKTHDHDDIKARCEALGITEDQLRAAAEHAHDAMPKGAAPVGDAKSTFQAIMAMALSVLEALKAAGLFHPKPAPAPTPGA